MREEVKPKMISLYDYLGKAGGGQIGAQLYEFAKLFKSPIGKRFINNPAYKGYVRTYPREVINKYFEVKKIL